MLKIALCALAAVPLVFLVRKKGVRFEPVALVLAVLLAAFQAVGHSYEHYGTFRAMFEVPSEIAFAVAAFAAYVPFLYLGLALAFAWADAAAVRAAERMRSNDLARFMPFWAAAGVLLLAWLPYLIVFAPGSFTYDGIFQMDMWHGFAAPSDHHPWAMTALMGSVFDMGRALGSDNLGVALWVGMQALVQALALAGSVSCMRRMGAPTAVLAAALAFFAVVPAWGAYAQAFLKDTLFASLFCLYVMLLAELWVRSRRAAAFDARGLVALTAAGVALCLARHNGAYVVALTMPLVIASMPSRVRVKAACACMIPLAAFVIVSRFVYPALDVLPSGKQETLGALFQQTARYVKEAPDDVTPEERAAIEAVLAYDALPELYYGSRSDTVKGTYTGNDEALGVYGHAAPGRVCGRVFERLLRLSVRRRKLDAQHLGLPPVQLRLGARHPGRFPGVVPVRRRRARRHDRVLQRLAERSRAGPDGPLRAVYVAAACGGGLCRAHRALEIAVRAGAEPRAAADLLRVARERLFALHAADHGGPAAADVVRGGGFGIAPRQVVCAVCEGASRRVVRPRAAGVVAKPFAARGRVSAAREAPACRSPLTV